MLGRPAALAVVLGSACATPPASTRDHAASSEVPVDDPLPLHGSVTTVLRGRWTSADDDADLWSTVVLDAGDPERHRWTAHLRARVAGDLDGIEDEDSVFFDLQDAEGDAILPRVYEASAERRGDGLIERTRLGRQTLWDAPTFAWIDGASVETKDLGAARARLGAYGGLPVRPYGSVGSGDLVAGAYGQARPWSSARVRLDWMRLEEDASPEDLDESVWKASAWQSIGRDARVDASVSRLGSEPRDWSAGATWWNRSKDVSLQASYFELLETQRRFPEEIDPFFETLGELFPYRQARLLASKTLGSKVSLQAGADVREVVDDADEGTWNHDFERWFTTVELREMLPAALVLGLTGEVWDGGGSDVRTWGLDVSRRFGERVEASAGSAYALYKVDAFTGSERDDVRTWYLRVRWKRARPSTFDVRYELEDLEPHAIQALRLSWTWRF